MNTTNEYPPRHIPGFRPLVPGEAWHRTDFTPDLLEDTDDKGPWRPLLLGEYEEQGDVLARNRKQCGMAIGQPAGESDFRRITRRPLPPPPPTFEHDGKTWTSHVPGDPCPVDKGKVIEVFTSGLGASYRACAEYFGWHVQESDKVYWGVIIGYRILDAEPVNETEQLCDSTEVATLKATVVRLDNRLADSLKRIAELEQQLATALTPRPIEEAGPVKEGFVRFYLESRVHGWMGATFPEGDDTHYLDIRLPSDSLRAEYDRAVAEAGGAFEAWLKAKGGVS